MIIICNNCKHEWNEEVDSGQQFIMCPECLTVIPIALLKDKSKEKEQSSASDFDAQTKITASPVAQDKDIYIEKTMKITGKPQEKNIQPDIYDEKTVKSAKFNAGKEKSDIQTFNLPKDASEKEIEKTRMTPPPVSKKDKFEASSQKAPSSQIPSKPQSQSQQAPPKIPLEYQQMIGKNIGGCIIEKLLGAGGMGAVFLAHQISLDRKVAIKILPERFSNNPELIARFTREALSAAQLNHHNIIQVYDVGNIGNLYYIIMEFVKGVSLRDVVKEQGRLMLDDAAGYVLQAARGLKYAHENNIIHRDIKPDNLMLNEHGIVKIADMGLAKWIKDVEAAKRDDGNIEARKIAQVDDDLTIQNIALGTPAYMSPEQAQDASSVDARSDQYSLGCTLYYLCAGKAPYSGTTVFELISKHINEPLTPLDVHVKGVPGSFKRTLEKMLEKNPANRFPGMKEVIRDFELYLGIDSEKGPFSPGEQHLSLLEGEQKIYYSVPAMKRRKFSKLAFYILLPILFILTLAGGNFPLAGGLLGLFVLTPVINFILNGLLTKDQLFRRVRNVFFGMSFKNWLALAAGTILTLAVLTIFGWILYWLMFAFIAFGLSVLYRLFVLKPLHNQRRKPIEQIQQMLREFRVHGLSEEALQDFVCRFSGVNWEEFFEEFFGYEDMLAARTKWAGLDKVTARKKFATWREPIARWLDKIEIERKKAREKKQLTKAEVQLLKSKGMSEQEAARQGELNATKILDSVRVKQKEKAEEYEKKIRAHRKIKLGSYGFIFKIILGLVGLLIAAAAATKVLPKYKIDALDIIADKIPNIYFGSGLGGTEFCLGAGIILFLMAFSKKIVPRILVLVGAILLAFMFPIIQMANQPMLNQTTAFFCGLGLVAVGFALSILSAISGGEF